MQRSKKSANPFYALLILAGLTFVVTAAAYGVMAVRESRAAVTGEPVAEHALMKWMHEHGNTALLTELAILGVCTFGAIGTDEFWQRRAAAQQASIKQSQRSDTGCGSRLAIQYSKLSNYRTMQLKKLLEVPANEVTMEGAAGCRVRQLVGEKDRAPTFAMREFEVAPGRPHASPLPRLRARSLRARRPGHDPRRRQSSDRSRPATSCSSPRTTSTNSATPAASPCGSSA